MILVYNELGEAELKQMEEFLLHDVTKMEELNHQIEEISEFYDNDMPPFLIGLDTSNKINGLVVLETVEEAIAYGSIITTDTLFLKELRKEFFKYHIFEASLSSKTELKEEIGFSLEDAEYKMVLSAFDAKRLLAQQSQKEDQVVLQPVKSSDQDYYTFLLRQLFCMADEEAAARFREVREEKRIQAYLVRHNGNRIGIASCYCGDTFTTLFDLAIAPEFQGLGLGEKMLYAILERTMERSCKYLLQVTHSNTNAVHLYQKAGFQIIERHMIYHLIMK